MRWIIDTFLETYGTIEQNSSELFESHCACSSLWYATQVRDAYPYYQHSAIGYNYRLSNVCAGIGRGQMKVLDAHIAHHKHVQTLYEELLKDVKGVSTNSPCMPALRFTPMV